jgi:hypothetical protein
MRTPNTMTVVLTANQQEAVPMAGAWVDVISCTQATIGIGFDSESPKVFYPGRGYPGPFEQLQVKDLSGAGCTVVLTVSDAPIGGQAAGGAQLTAVQANGLALASILAALQTIQPGGTISVIAEQTLMAGSPGTLIAAANPNRKRIVLFGDETMTGTAYIGPTNAVSATNKIGQLKKLGAWPETYKGAIYGVGSIAGQIVGGYELL